MSSSLVGSHRAQWTTPHSHRALVARSSLLPSGGEPEFDFCLTYRKIERGLADASRCAQPVGIEQLEDAALAGVVTHLRDALDLSGALERLGAIAGRRIAALGDGGAERRDLAAQHSKKRCRSRVGLPGPRFGERAFRLGAIEEWNRGMHGEHAAEIASQGA